MGALIRVVVVDDHPLVQWGLAGAFAANPALGIEVVGTAGSSDEAVSLAERCVPDVVLCDVMLDGEPAGLRLIEPLRALLRPPAIVMLSSYDAPGFVAAALRAGAAGYLLKTAPLDDISGAVHAAAAGHPATPSWLLDRARASPPAPSPRELAVIRTVASGRSNSEVAHALGLRTKTVESYLHDLYERLGVASRTELVTLAIRQGWLSGQDEDRPGG
ncbi:MAG: response regulator transcription factor [Chloroflexi bacterium]|nr:response regulator transcription factor [Chloroflexota bacterium]